jgi:thiol-disulfide isomerase/thioredoxin
VALVGSLSLVACGSDDASAPASPEPVGDALPRFEGDPDGAAGMPIPEVSGETLDGEAITIGPDGPARVIVFLAHWCPHCQAEVPRIVEHLAENPLPDDVELLGVATSTNPDAPNYPPGAWLDREGWTAPTLDDVDNTVAPKFGLSAFPFFVAVGPDGTVVVRGSGELSVEEFDQLVEAARTGSL